VVLSRLQAALAKGSQKFPGFFVVLKLGFFWSYIEEDTWESALRSESSWPCMASQKGSARRSLLRVIPWVNRIAFEFSHTLTDGVGAWIFIQGIIGEYLGFSVGAADDHKGQETAPGSNAAQAFDPEAWENGFRRYGDQRLPFSEPGTRAFRPTSPLLPVGHYRLITGLAPTQTLLQAAKKLDLKLGEFLVAVLLAALQKIALSGRPGTGMDSSAASSAKFTARSNPRVLRVLVPVDLRKFFPSKTMRNFFAYVAPEIDLGLGHRSLEEIAHEVRWQMRGSLVPWKLKAHFSQHVKKEANLGLRIIPGFIKRFFLVLGFPLAGENKFSASLSNLGKADWGTLDPGLIRRVLFAPPPSPWTKTNCSVVSSGDETAITFGSTARTRDLEREFFRLLVSTAGEVRITGGTL